MEKLRQLLNSYEEYKEKETGYSNYDWRLNEINDEEEYEQWITAFRVDDSQLCVEESIAVIICKGYMFINWLVENEKIDLGKIFKVTKNNKLSMIADLDNNEFDWEESILMILSIVDDPVSFLISILK